MTGISPEDPRRSLTDLAPVALYEIDAGGTIVYSNGAHHRLLGHPEGTLVGRNVADLVPRLDAERLRADLAYLRAETPEPMPYVNRAYHADGREIVVRVHWTYRFDAEGRVAGFVAMLEDITGRVEAERQRDEAQRAAEDAARACAQSLAAASHDLRQPMQALRLFLGRLQRRDLDAVGSEILGDMQESVGALSALLDALLDVSRLDAGLAVPAVKPVALAEVFAGIERDFRPLAERAAVRLRVRPTVLSARTDTLLLRRIVGNLVANAVTYSERGRVLVAARRRGRRVLVQVWDTGMGIPEAEQETVFREFYRIGRTGPAATAEQEGGLGLGLAIVARLCRALGHTVTVRSRPGRGTVFSVDLPAAPSSGAGAGSGAGAIGGAALPALPAVMSGTLPALGAVVAVAEDHPPGRRALAALLEEWGCTVIAASGGPALLLAAAAAPRPPDVLVADLYLPGGLDGLATAAALAGDLGRPLPGVILTGDTDNHAGQRVAAAGLSLLHKPVDASRLHAVLRRLLGSGR